MIDANKMWEEEWSNAKKFFETKGNINTKAKLKKIWYDSFFKMLKSSFNAGYDHKHN